MEVSVTNKKGMLIVSDGEVYFRVQDKSEEGFTDYYVRYCDLDIRILSYDAVLISEDVYGEPILDYDHNTLGIKER